MRVSKPRRFDDPVDVPAGGVATIGVFDGVHRGHAAIIDRVVAAASRFGGPAVAVTFSVHPVVVVKRLPPRSITSLPHRLRLLERRGLDHVVVLPFDEEVRAVSAERFARRVFLDVLRLRGLLVGPDARIGRDREGDTEFLARFAAEHDLSFEVVPPVLDRGEPVSSTKVRAAIADGDLERAARMLGRPVSLLGRVVQGEGRGRRIGFPTANLDLDHEIRPPAGVYAGRTWLEGKTHGAVLNIGVRPTFGPDGDLTVEVHLLDFDGDLYGRTLEVEVLFRLRGEERFDGPEALAERIRSDCDRARRLLSEV